MAGDATGTADQYLRLLDNETRWEIVRELGLTFDPTHPEGTGLAFSELFRRVSIEDSGAFTYHLEKLLGVLVSKDDDGEYHPILGRVKPAQHLYAWTRPWDETEEWVETDHECHRSDCSRQVHLVYNELFRGRVGLHCPEHGGLFVYAHLPPAGVDRSDPDEVVRKLVVRNLQGMTLMREEICPNCWSGVTGEFVTIDGYLDELDDPLSAYGPLCKQYACDTCGWTGGTSSSPA